MLKLVMLYYSIRMFRKNNMKQMAQASLMKTPSIRVRFQIGRGFNYMGSHYTYFTKVRDGSYAPSTAAELCET